MSSTSDIVILADWGNSSGRLFCVKGTGLRPEILDIKRVVGAKDTSDCAGIFAEAVQPWIDRYDISEALFSGAVTSNIGWLTTDYAPAPAQPDDVLRKTLTDNGLTCTFLSGTSVTEGPLGYFDTVRGEDMQAFGWMALTGLRDGVLCTPGTHTKWLTIKGGAIVSILTGVTGETFEVLNSHSILTRGSDQPSHETAEFDRGLRVMSETPRPALTQMLMSVRNLQLSGDMTATRSADYLSGLLTGEDCAAALDILPRGPIHIIGDGHAVKRYKRALLALEQEIESHDGQTCVIAGLQSLRS
jgi:2-dehydro-3-deoxygalactonokinase